jgi:hypothetical protein
MRKSIEPGQRVGLQFGQPPQLPGADGHYATSARLKKVSKVRTDTGIDMTPALTPA